MEEKFKVLVSIGGHPGLAQAKISVTENEYELLCNLAKIINDPWQEAYSPYMKVERLPKSKWV